MKLETGKRGPAKATKERSAKHLAVRKAAADLRTTCDSSNLLSDMPASSIGGSSASRQNAFKENISDIESLCDIRINLKG